MRREIPRYGEKRGHASLRNEIISVLSALSRDGSFNSASILGVFARREKKIPRLSASPATRSTRARLIGARNVCN